MSTGPRELSARERAEQLRNETPAERRASEARFIAFITAQGETEYKHPDAGDFRPEEEREGDDE